MHTPCLKQIQSKTAARPAENVGISCLRMRGAQGGVRGGLWSPAQVADTYRAERFLVRSVISERRHARPTRRAASRLRGALRARLRRLSRRQRARHAGGLDRARDQLLDGVPEVPVARAWRL